VRFCFISPATVAPSERDPAGQPRRSLAQAARPPIGILTLASVLQGSGIEQSVIDLNRVPQDGGLFPNAVDALRLCGADIFGFGTIAGSFPLTLRLAQEVRLIRPNSFVILGGPQATALDVEILEAFPFIDLVVRGEAEAALPLVLESLGNPQRLSHIPGITFHNAGVVVCTPMPSTLPDLDALPDPAFEFWPGLEKLDSAPLEIGRGCPFSCSFCSTSTFFRRRFRLKSPGRVLSQMRRIRDLFGVESFSLIHDAFTVDRARVLAFCEALEASSDHFRWACSARTDCLDEELLARMAGAGCSGIFLGIETGSARLQESIHKCLDLDEARAAVRRANGHGIKTSVSMITGFPDETWEDVRASVDFLCDSLCFDKVAPQFHLLAPLGGTEIHKEFGDRLQWDGIFSDMAAGGWEKDPENQRLVREHPDVFPDLFAVPTTYLCRERLMELRSFFVCGVRRFRWLMIALHQYEGGLLDVFHHWRITRNPFKVPDPEYYDSAIFSREFLAFVASHYVARSGDPEFLAVATLLDYERQIRDEDDRPARDPETGGTDPPVVNLHAIPCLPAGVTLIHLAADYQSIIDCLRNKQSPRDVPRRPVVLADRETPDGSIEVVQLSPLSAALLELCDGTRTVKEIADVFPKLDDDLAQLPPGPACLFALDDLAQQHLLNFRSAAACK
jgi:radical SAM superfamily enzyme YgiQ (UPF0313 family)